MTEEKEYRMYVSTKFQIATAMWEPTQQKIASHVPQNQAEYKITKKPAKVSDVKHSAMDTIDILLYFSFII